MTATRGAVREVGLAEGVALARELAERIGQVVPDRAAPLLVHCEVGARSARAAARLAELGYQHVVNLRAPIRGWAEAGGAWEAPADALTDEQRRRYARQLLVPEMGVAGQQALLAARVLLIGAGGLGSPVALYLAAAGVGTLGIVDDDAVEESNLHRQVLHATDRLGARKVASAERTLRTLNPEVRVVTHDERLEAGNVERLLAGYDVVVDGTDSLEARYLINDATVRLRRPVVHGSVHRWDGQVTTFVPGGPCYRCLHPVPPPPELAPACAVAGVVGVVPGIVGMLQATEVLKLLLAAGETLAGRLLIVDALGTTFDEIRVERNPACPACGDQPG